jgi:predicted Zn-dependent protease
MRAPVVSVNKKAKQGCAMNCKRASWFVGLILLSGCAVSPSEIHPLTDGTPSTNSQLNEDEQELFKNSIDAHQEFVRSGVILNDPALQSYVNTVGHKLIPPNIAPRINFNFYIIRSPIVNAFAMPNGNIYIDIGLLARLENEAQLAQILGHETAHVVQRHSLIQKERSQSSLVTAHVADLLLFGTSIAYLPYLTSSASHSREQELEADRMGIELMQKAGYRLDNTDQLFALMQEVKNAESVEGSIYSSHPDNLQRAEAVKKLIDTQYIDVAHVGTLGDGVFDKYRTDILEQDIKLKLSKNLYELAEDRAKIALTLEPHNPDFYYLLGECYRLRADHPDEAAKEQAWLYNKKPDDELKNQFKEASASNQEKAKEYYEKALSLNSKYADAYKGLGLIAYKEKQANSRMYLEKYLADSTGTVKDRRYIEGLIKTTNQ